MSARKRIGVLISGRGSNMSALIDACNNLTILLKLLLLFQINLRLQGLK